MTKIKNKWISTLFVMSGFFAFSQEKKTLTLDEAVSLGIENSKLLRIDATKVTEATANYLEAKNNKLPSLKVSGSALALANANVELKALPSQGGSSTPKANSAFYGGLNASLPIYAGGRIQYGIKSAEYLVEASKLSAENNKIAVAYNVSQAYNNLFKASQAITVLQENLKAAQKRDETFLKMENNGLMARNDRLKANLQTSEIELQLLNAENNFNIATINMDLLLGLPETTVLEIQDDYIEEQWDVKPVDYYLSQAMAERKDIKALEYQAKATELAIKSAKAENLPTIALTGGYIAADVPKILTVYNAANIGIGVQYNIDNLWKKNSNLIKAKAKEEEIQATHDLLNDQISLAVNTDYQNMEYAKRKIEVYHKASEQANENYRITNRKFENGLATMTDLLDANADQIAANVNEINAKADSVLAYRKLLQTIGILTVK